MKLDSRTLFYFIKLYACICLLLYRMSSSPMIGKYVARGHVANRVNCPDHVRRCAVSTSLTGPDAGDAGWCSWLGGFALDHYLFGAGAAAPAASGDCAAPPRPGIIIFIFGMFIIRWEDHVD
jgi:hypothetical protein